jgi:amidohydrolase
MKPDLLQYIDKKSLALFEHVKGIREHLHANPELSFEEFETMEYVCQQLDRIGISYEKGFGKTGVVALIKADHHSGNESCIGLRADLDALPIIEQNEVSYSSLNEGVMHACGHDVHTSILLGAAEILHDLRNELTSPVKLIFQPGEEKNPGGASILIEKGVLKNPHVEKMFALHVYPELESGKVGFKKGMYMASCDEIYITIHGKGGHGAMPHQCIDPIMIGANVLTELQQVVSRKCDPKIPCVLSFGHFEALGATNVIPEKAHLKGTFRTMNEDWRNEALRLIESNAKNIIENHGGIAEITISKGYPFLINDDQLTDQMILHAKEILGEQNVIDLPIRMTAEDFSYYSQEVPVCFFRLGVGNQSLGITHSVHHPRFDIDPSSLITGMKMMSSIPFL